MSAIFQETNKPRSHDYLANPNNRTRPHATRLYIRKPYLHIFHSQPHYLIAPRL
jgi:hypothetical protein